MFIYISVDSYYIRSVVPSLIYGKDNLLIQCMQQNLQRKDSIYKITLSKIVNGIPRALLAVESDTNSPPAFLKVWLCSFKMLFSLCSFQSTIEKFGICSI